MPINLYLDDVREAPCGWVRVRSVNAAKSLLSLGKVIHLSLDHDLGDFAKYGGDGYELVKWMAEMGNWPIGEITVHSMNPVGRQNMQAVIDRYHPRLRA